MANNVAAKRYAKALFDLSTEKNVVEDVHRDLEALIALMAHSPEWNAFIREPFGPLEKRDKVLTEALTGRAHPLTLQFLAFINRKRRIQLLPAMFDAWLALHDEARGILRAEVISAAPLATEQADALKERLAKRFGKEIVLTTRVDEAMIGGLKVYIGDHVFDYSIESRLQQLRKEMLHA